MVSSTIRGTHTHTLHHSLSVLSHLVCTGAINITCCKVVFIAVVSVFYHYFWGVRHRAPKAFCNISVRYLWPCLYMYCIYTGTCTCSYPPLYKCIYVHVYWHMATEERFKTGRTRQCAYPYRCGVGARMKGREGGREREGGLLMYRHLSVSVHSSGQRWEAHPSSLPLSHYLYPDSSTPPPVNSPLTHIPLDYVSKKLGNIR